MSYRVDWSVEMRQRFQQLHAEALATGQGTRLRESLARLVARLRVDPYDVGELLYHTGAGDPVHLAASGSLAITFTVFESIHAVCIVRVERLAE